MYTHNTHSPVALPIFILVHNIPHCPLDVDIPGSHMPPSISPLLPAKQHSDVSSEWKQKLIWAGHNETLALFGLKYKCHTFGK